MSRHDDHAAGGRGGLGRSGQWREGLGSGSRPPREPGGARGAGKGGAERGSPVQPRRVGGPRPTGRTRSASWRRRPPAASPSSSRSATGGWSSSPFAFYRGAAAIMASDLAGTPRSGIKVQTCGDAHVSNFGLFGSPERELVFDINDFDETLPGPWEWDVKRLAASLAIAGRNNGFSAKRAPRGRSCGRPRVPDRDARVRGHAQPRRLVRASATSRRGFPACGPCSTGSQPQRGGEARRRRRGPRTACRPSRS